MPDGLPSPTPESVPDATRVDETAGKGAVDEEVAAERHLMHRVLLGVAFGIPVGMLLVVGILFLATSGADVPRGSIAAMGAVVGVFAGAFFGALAGFMVSTHELDEVDHHSYHVA